MNSDHYYQTLNLKIAIRGAISKKPTTSDEVEIAREIISKLEEIKLMLKSKIQV
jgi:hypothetical protein